MKRYFNKTEAMHYLGVKRRFFDNSLMPYLEGKTTKAGSALIFDRSDLDQAWESYKLSQNTAASTANPRLPTSKLSNIESFESVVAKVGRRNGEN